MPPPPSPKATILNYLNDGEREGVIIFCRILTPRNAPHPPTPQYLTILITERGGAIIFCGILPPPPLDATILNYLYDRERGRHYLLWDFGAPNAPPPPPLTPQYLTILMTGIGGGGTSIAISCRKLNI